jgi:hypothetical protein
MEIEMDAQDQEQQPDGILYSDMPKEDQPKLDEPSEKVAGEEGTDEPDGTSRKKALTPRLRTLQAKRRKAKTYPLLRNLTLAARTLKTLR